MRPLAIVENYSQLVEVLRARAETLNVSNLVLDEVSGLPSGYCGKVLGLHPNRTLGRLSLPLLLSTLGLKLAVLSDDEQLAKMRSRLTPRRNNGPRRGYGQGGESAVR
jgi:hypothetical protein